MQERIEIGRIVEVSAGNRHESIAEKRRAPADQPPEPLKLGGRERIPAKGRARAQNHQQCRRQTANAARIESPQGERFCLYAREDELGNEVAGNDEENIDAGESAGQECREGVIDQYGHHGNRAQAVDIRSIRQCALRSARMVCRDYARCVLADRVWGWQCTQRRVAGAGG